MLLKKHYKHVLGSAVLDKVEAKRFGARQNFTPRIIERGTTEGWLSLVDGHIVIHSTPNELIYKIVRGPGWYSCFDNTQFSGEQEARQHIEAHHKGELSPDRSNPSGYRRINHYECELIDLPTWQPRSIIDRLREWVKKVRR
jgi:hypothetical protein